VRLLSSAVLSLVFLSLSGCVGGKIKDEDRPLLATIADLEGYGFDLASYADRETFRRTRYLDGSLEIEYEFETPDGAADTVYLAATAGFERTTRDAVAAFLLEKKGVGLGVRVGGGEVVEQPGFFDWGDDSYFATIVGEHGPGGVIFGGRSGRKTYWLMLGGVYFDDAEEWERFISPKLHYLVSYEP
jgi:hypothetical protein